MSEKKKPDALAAVVKMLKEKQEKREAVKANAKDKGKGKAKALTDKQRIDVIWEYLGLDE